MGFQTKKSGIMLCDNKNRVQSPLLHAVSDIDELTFIVIMYAPASGLGLLHMPFDCLGARKVFFLLLLVSSLVQINIVLILTYYIYMYFQIP